MNKNKIKDLSEELCSQVVGATSVLLASLLDSEDHKELSAMSDKDHIFFLSHFIDRFSSVYATQIKTIYEMRVLRE